MTDTKFIQGGIDPVAYQELVEALAASEARERTLRALIAGLPGRLRNLAIDLDTGSTKARVAQVLNQIANQIAALPDAPAPETGPGA